jgi:ADP-heptose:LPS heptosyltransferase
MKIAFCQNQTLGDLIIASPMLQALRVLYPTAVIHSYVDFEYSQFLKDANLVSDCAWNGRMRTSESPIIYSDSSGYDLGINCGFQTSNVNGAASTVNSVLDLASAVPPGLQRLQHLSSLSVPTVNYTPSFRVTPNPEYNGYVAIHATGELGKNWFVERWLEVCKELVKSVKLLLIEGRVDFLSASRLYKALPVGSAKVLSNASLSVVASALQACRALIGSETGISHLAHALGIPTLALWNELYPQWVPAGMKTVVHPDIQINSITPAEVLAVYQTI